MCAFLVPYFNLTMNKMQIKLTLTVIYIKNCSKTETVLKGGLSAMMCFNARIQIVAVATEKKSRNR